MKLIRYVIMPAAGNPILATYQGAHPCYAHIEVVTGWWFWKKTHQLRLFKTADDVFWRGQDGRFSDFSRDVDDEIWRQENRDLFIKQKALA